MKHVKLKTLIKEVEVSAVVRLAIGHVLSPSPVYAMHKGSLIGRSQLKRCSN